MLHIFFDICGAKARAAAQQRVQPTVVIEQKYDGEVKTSEQILREALRESVKSGNHTAKVAEAVGIYPT